MNLCVECGHDYDLDGQWSGCAHYVKGSDPGLGFFRPVCNEGVPVKFSPETEQAIDDLAKKLANRMNQTLWDLGIV